MEEVAVAVANTGLQEEEGASELVSKLSYLHPETSGALGKPLQSTNQGAGEKDSGSYKLECFLFFTVATGYTGGWHAVILWASYYGNLFQNQSVLLPINACVFCPALLINVLQMFLDRKYDRKFSSMQANKFRLVFSLATNTAVSCVIPFANTTKKMEVLFPLIILQGVMYATAYGTMNQIVALFPKECNGFLSLGFQSPGLLFLLVDLVSGSIGHGDSLPSDRQMQFHFQFGTFLCFCGLVASLVLMRRPSFKTRLEEVNRSLLEPLRTKVDTDQNNQETEAVIKSSKSYNEYGSYSRNKLCRELWPALAGMLMSLIFSMGITPFYNYVRSSTKDPNFSTHLTYAKIISDSVGRPMAGFFTIIKTQNGLFWISLFRLLILTPIFFLYVEQQFPANDAVAYTFIVLVSISSGYIITTGYRLATSSVPLSSKLDAASFLGLSFQGGFYAAFIIDYVLQHSINWKFCQDLTEHKC